MLQRLATLPWQGLAHLPLPPGSRALIHGGAGGVGSMAIQASAGPAGREGSQAGRAA